MNADWVGRWGEESENVEGASREEKVDESNFRGVVPVPAQG